MSLEPITIVMPVYNEGENIKSALSRIHSDVHVPYNLHIVYDFDGDTTLPAARDFLEGVSMPVTFVKNDLGKGVLNALKKGLSNSESELTVVTMADLSDPPEVINKMVERAMAEDLDVVSASRYMKGGKQIGGPFFKRFLSQSAGVSLKMFTGIPTHDISNNFRLYRNRVLNSFEIESTGGFEVAMELTVKAYAAGMKVGEVPTVWSDREAGTSNFRLWKWLPKYLRWYFFALSSRFRKWI